MTFEVGVKLQTGERFEIEANGDETVADLKNRIEVSLQKGVNWTVQGTQSGRSYIKVDFDTS